MISFSFSYIILIRELYINTFYIIVKKGESTMSNEDRLKIIIVLLIILIMTIIFCTITIIEKLDLVQHTPSLVRIVG